MRERQRWNAKAIVDAIARRLAPRNAGSRGAAPIGVEDDAAAAHPFQALRDALLSRVLSRLVAAGEPREMAREIFQAIAGDMQLDAYFNYDLEPGSDTMRLASCAGVDNDARAQVERIPVGRFVCGRVAETAMPAYVPSLQSSDDAEAQYVRRQGFRVYFCSPLVVGGRVLGTLSFASRRRDAFDDDERAFLAALSSHLAIAKDRATNAAALANSARNLTLALATARLGTWYYDVERDEISGDARTAEIFGLPLERAPVGFAAAIVPMIDGNDAERVRAALARAIDADGDGGFDARFGIVRSVDGEARHVECLGQAVFDVEHGARRARHVSGTVHDVTDRVVAERERESLLSSERHARRDAERAVRLKDEFLATLSHELRTPLNAVLGWTQVLRMRHGSDPSIAEGLAIVERNARAQAQIIEDLLDMSRIMSGKVQIDVEVVDLATVVRAAIETIRPSADAKRVGIAFACEADLPYVRGDSNRLQQVMWNLLSNAVKFSPAGRSVGVTLRRTGDQLEVAVADEGSGIDPRFVPYLFERFRQADGSTARRFGGLGLGLAIVKQLVDLHGGSIVAESAGSNRGATFTVRLAALDLGRAPALESQAEASASGGQDQRSRSNLAGARVLVVEDDPDAREFTARLLREWGADVDTAASAGEAIDELQRARPDLLVSDIGMPGEDGYGLMRRVRAMAPERGGGLPAVALTAYARAEDRLQALQAGFDMHVPKPVEPAELLAVCSKLLSQSR